MVFARLLQFAGGNGKAWPSIERVANEVALSVPQTRRCVTSLESKGFIRRVARSGRSNEFEFLWHAMYHREPRSPMIDVPRSPMSDRPPSSMSGPGRSSVIARRESIESSSSEEIQIEKNQHSSVPKTIDSRKLIDDDCAHRREGLDDPEQEFLLRLQERHTESRSIATLFCTAFSGI